MSKILETGFFYLFLGYHQCQRDTEPDSYQPGKILLQETVLLLSSLTRRNITIISLEFFS
jgi:hypothetical protein